MNRVSCLNHHFGGLSQLIVESHTCMQARCLNHHFGGLSQLKRHVP